MRRVILESPYAGQIARNVHYAQDCLADCLKRGEAPFASHLLYTQPNVLKDDVAAQRKLGIEAGFAWYGSSDCVVVYTDLGISKGMRAGMAKAEELGLPVEHRSIGGFWSTIPGMSDQLLAFANAKNQHVVSQRMIDRVLVRVDGVEVDLAGRAMPAFEQLIKGVYKKVKTGEIDSEQGVSLAFRNLEASSAARLLNRQILSHAQYSALEKLHWIVLGSGEWQRTTASYGEGTGGGQSNYGMPVTEMQAHLRQQLRAAREAMGQHSFYIPSLDTVHLYDLHHVAEMVAVRDATLADCGRYVADTCQWVSWSKTVATERGKEALLEAADRLVKHWDIRVRDE